MGYGIDIFLRYGIKKHQFQRFMLCKAVQPLFEVTFAHPLPVSVMLHDRSLPHGL